MQPDTRSTPRDTPAVPTTPEDRLQRFVARFRANGDITEAFGLEDWWLVDDIEAILQARSTPAEALDVDDERFAAVLHGWEHGDSTPMDNCRHGHILDARYLRARLSSHNGEATHD